MNERRAPGLEVPPEDPGPKHELTPDQWQHIRELLATAISLSIEEQRGYVALTDAGDERLRAEL